MAYTNSELMRFARRLIEKYGGDAADRAEQHARHLGQADDPDGHALWMRAGRLIREMAREAA
jgi:hypothetical protein